MISAADAGAFAAACSRHGATRNRHDRYVAIISAADARAVACATNRSHCAAVHRHSLAVAVIAAADTCSIVAAQRRDVAAVDDDRTGPACKCSRTNTVRPADTCGIVAALGKYRAGAAELSPDRQRAVGRNTDGGHAVRTRHRERRAIGDNEIDVAGDRHAERTEVEIVCHGVPAVCEGVDILRNNLAERSLLRSCKVAIGYRHRLRRNQLVVLFAAQRDRAADSVRLRDKCRTIAAGLRLDDDILANRQRSCRRVSSAAATNAGAAVAAIRNHVATIDIDRATGLVPSAADAGIVARHCHITAVDRNRSARILRIVRSDAGGAGRRDVECAVALRLRVDRQLVGTLHLNRGSIRCIVDRQNSVVGEEDLDVAGNRHLAGDRHVALDDVPLFAERGRGGAELDAVRRLRLAARVDVRLGGLDDAPLRVERLVAGGACWDSVNALASQPRIAVPTVETVACLCRGRRECRRRLDGVVRGRKAGHQRRTIPIVDRIFNRRELRPELLVAGRRVGDRGHGIACESGIVVPSREGVARRRRGSRRQRCADAFDVV